MDVPSYVTNLIITKEFLCVNLKAFLLLDDHAITFLSGVSMVIISDPSYHEAFHGTREESFNL